MGVFESKKILFVDIDDTLLYWYPEYMKWLFVKNFNDGSQFDTHDLKSMLEKSTYMEFNKSENFKNRDAIEPIYKFVYSMLEREDVAVIFTSACGSEAYDQQLDNIRELFEGHYYGVHICDDSKEKIEFINNMLKEDRIVGILLDDKRETNEAVSCYATDSKDINHLRHMSKILWGI